MRHDLRFVLVALAGWVNQQQRDVKVPERRVERSLAQPSVTTRDSRADSCEAVRPQPLVMSLFLSAARRFPTTRWTLVRTAGGTRSSQSQEALATLCEAYWYPLYACLRGRGVSIDDAQDLTQGFLARVIEKGALARADPARGRFRSFLLASLTHYAANERDRAVARKRGGPLLNLEGAEARYQLEPHSDLTPERLFERRWALTLLSRVLARLRQEFASTGKEPTFEALKRWLTADGGGASYREAAAGLGLSEPAVRVAVHRMRRRYHALLRDEVGRTVATPRDVDAELEYLRRAIHDPSLEA